MLEKGGQHAWRNLISLTCAANLCKGQTLDADDTGTRHRNYPWHATSPSFSREARFSMPMDAETLKRW